MKSMLGLLLAFAVFAKAASVGAMDTRLTAVSATPVVVCPGSARVMTRTEMLFGRSRPLGGFITDAEWTSFLDAEVTPYFPAGLTVLRGLGQWRDKEGRLAKEESSVLVIWHELTERANTDIETIRSTYRKRFDQESVMRVDGASCVSF